VSGVNLWYLSLQDEWLSPLQSWDWKNQGFKTSLKQSYTKSHKPLHKVAKFQSVKWEL